MDLAFTADEQRFADEARRWLGDHLDLPGAFADDEAEIEWGRRWQATMAADRWVGIHWPREFGGREASPVQVAIFNMEYARARAPQPRSGARGSGVRRRGPRL